MADLYKEEYQTLRKEVEVAMSELNVLESACALSVAAIYAWLAVNGSEGLLRVAWYLPSALVGFCILRAWSILRHLGWLGEYLQKYEKLYLQPTLLGWEHFLAQDELGKARGPRRGFRGRVTVGFWTALLVATLFFGHEGYVNRPMVGAVAKCSTKSGSLTSPSRPTLASTLRPLALPLMGDVRPQC
jgi:hypothetical protein